MSDQDTRIIPPGQLGSRIFEPSGSMNNPDGIYFGADYFTDPARAAAVLASLMAERQQNPGGGCIRCDGGTDMAGILAQEAANLVPAPERDRYQIVITDGDPFIAQDEEGRESLRQMLDRLGPVQLVFLDELGVRPTPCAPRVVYGDGLLPVPEASELVARICDTVSGEAQPARSDQCCGCGGCDKK